MITLRVADVDIVVDPSLGGRAVSWRVAEEELLHRHGDDPVEFGMYPMAPWAGRIRDNEVMASDGPRALPVTYGEWAIHGTVLDQPLAVVHRIDEHERQAVVLETSHHPTWPWPLTVRVSWTLEVGVLTTEIGLLSPVDGSPVVTGWHPWFRREISGSRGEWWLEAPRLLRRGDDALSLELMADGGTGPFDDAFWVPSGRASIHWPGQLGIDVVTDGAWYVVYDERPEAICLEPQSGPPDGLADHPWHTAERLTADVPRSWRTTWTMRDLREGRG